MKYNYQCVNNVTSYLSLFFNCLEYIRIVFKLDKYFRRNDSNPMVSNVKVYVVTTSECI